MDTMFSTREVPWLKIGSEIDFPVTAEEAATLGGLDFDIKLEPAGYQRSDGSWVEAPNRYAIVREDTGDVFQYTTEKYHPVQYREAFEFVDSISPKFVAAGELRGGRQGFMVAEVPSHVELMLNLRGKEDPHRFYVILRTSQDLTKGIEIALTTLRGKCMNMLTLPSLTKDAAQKWRVRHTASVQQKLADAHRIITGANRYAEEFASIAERLADIDISPIRAKNALERILPDKPERQKQIIGILDAYQDSETNGFEGTGWGLVQAVNEYGLWLRPTGKQTDESRFMSALDGQIHDLTARTATVLLSARRS